MEAEIEWWQWGLPIMATGAVLLIIALIRRRGRMIVSNACVKFIGGIPRDGRPASRTMRVIVVVVMGIAVLRAIAKTVSLFGTDR